MVSLEPSSTGEGRYFSLFLGPLEVVCFKCVHLVDPEAQSISSQSIVQREAETYEEQGGHRLILLPAGMLCLNHLQVFHLR